MNTLLHADLDADLHEHAFVVALHDIQRGDFRSTERLLAELATDGDARPTLRAVGFGRRGYLTELKPSR